MVKRGFKTMMAEANAVIETVSVQDALKLVDDPEVLFIDVRETAELKSEGTIAGAIHAPRGFLEFLADPESPMHNRALSSGKRLLLFCASGGRSTFAARTLNEMGIENVAHIAGGFSAWRQARGPVVAVG
jgi:rhodanese-related sulfurtransferase